MKEKIAIIGCNYSWSLETYYMQYLSTFKEIDFRMISISEFRDTQYRFSDKIMNRIFHSRNPFFNKVNKYLIHEVNRIKPTKLVIFKGMEIYPETLDLWKKQGIFLANYNPDHPFIIDSRGGGTQNISRSIQKYDLHFCYSLKTAKEIEEKFNIRTSFLPFGYELPEHIYNEVQLSPKEETNKVCFLGNPDKKREEVISKILKSGFHVDVYGHDWHKTSLKKHRNIQINPAVIGVHFWEVLKRYRVQLNIFRRHNIGSHNMRTFEIPAIGAIQLAPYSEEQLLFFKPDHEVVFYNTEDEMLLKTDFLMNMNLSDATEMRQQARSRSVTSDYSYANRAAQMAETLHKI